MRKTHVLFSIIIFPLSFLLGGEGNHSPLVQTIQNGQIIIQADSVDLLTYQLKTVYPPAGVDSVFKRSGFIHPLRTPHGQLLTRIQPPDHYHHYGIWDAWTHVLFKSDTIDFWNLNGRQGTVRFSKLLHQNNGEDFSEFEAEHEYVVFHPDGSEEIALKGTWKVRVSKSENDRYTMDLVLTYQCATENPFKILEYRYAGLGWRATEAWDKDNSEVQTSEGLTRKDADGSLAKWFMIQGQLEQDFGGVLMCSHPGNFNHPEPLRIWPETMYERGDIFAMFAPTKNTDWFLEPGKIYTLRYRFLIFNDQLSAQDAKKAWIEYSRQSIEE